MSAADPPADGQAVSTMPCPACGTDVPAGAFCGSCGTNLFARQGDWRDRLRIAAYAAAPGEHVLRLSVTSSLFPHLPHRSRTTFRAGLTLLLIALAAFALLRWQAPLVATGALGFPLLFLVYLHESDVHRDMPVRTLALTAVVGIGLGVGWALLAGNIVADSYDVALGAGTAVGHMLLEGLAIPAGGAVLMLVPAVLVRLLRPRTRESLDGFVIGSLGAVGFTAATTLTRLAPQLATGLVARDRSVSGLLVEAGIQGVAMPLTAAAAGGMVGAALWFTRPTGPSQRRRGPASAGLLASVLVVVALYAISGLVDVAPLPQGLQLGLQLLIMGLALLALRIGLQGALLREAHDDMNPGAQVLCPHCDHVVPDMAFCPSCGVASRAASRTSRTARRLETPRREDDSASAPAAAGAPAARPGYAVPPGSYAAAPVHHTTYRRLLLTVGVGVGVAAAAAVVVSALLTPTPARYVCPPDCGRPPMGTPVATNPRFTSSDGDFSVSYPGPGTAYNATLNPNGVVLDFVSGDTGTLELFSEPAHNRTAQEIADDLIKRSYPDATVDYEIPNASVGYQPGYGVIADDYPQDSTGTYTRLRVLVMVAVKNDLALIASAVGPYHQFSPDFGTGHPSGANLQLALDMAKYVNSFTWRGDPAR